MPINNKLKYPWLRAMRLISPLFEVGDRVRQRWGNLGRIPCYPDRRKVLPQVILRGRPYLVRQIIFFEGGSKKLTGYRIELAEEPGTWFWATDFIKTDHCGWIAPASDLSRVDSNFFGWLEADYVWLWSSPCEHCCTPRLWYLLEKDPHYRCDICGIQTHDHRRTRWLETVLGHLDHIAPGKKVRPTGPGVLPKILPDVPDDPTIGPLDPDREYVVESFFKGNETLVVLRDVRGIYSLTYLEVS